MVHFLGPVTVDTPPLNKLNLAPNTYGNNVLLGGTCAYPPAESGCKKETLHSGWSEDSELGDRKPLTPEEVGPAWVIARLRRLCQDYRLEGVEELIEEAGLPK